MAEKKIYVIDTNVFIHDPLVLNSFHTAEVGIPLVVIKELDQFKSDVGSKGRNAREAIRILDRLREEGSLAHGVVYAQDILVRILPTPLPDMVKRIALDDNDDRILASALELKQQGYLVTFITKDLNMRVRANALDIHAEDYKKEHVAEDDFYKGWRSYELSAGEFQGDHPAILKEILQEQSLFLNEFVVLKSKRNEENYRVFRYQGSERFKAVHAPELLWPIRPKNWAQLMAFDLLFDDEIQMVSLLGPAGTGKTFLVLVAAMHKLLIEHSYKKVLVARPVEPLGRDIGFLPGDIQDKLFTWMQPVRDNMELIIHKAHSAYDQGLYDDLYQKDDKGRKRRKKKKDDKWRVPSVDELISGGLLSLEAITYMRGRSIPDQYILIDEVQNLTLHEVKTLITRVGEGSKIILAGDPYQIDSPYLDFSSNGLVLASEKLKGTSICASVFLQKSERSLLSQLAGELL